MNQVLGTILGVIIGIIIVELVQKITEVFFNDSTIAKIIMLVVFLIAWFAFAWRW
jgi:hypothetical protein